MKCWSEQRPFLHWKWVYIQLYSDKTTHLLHKPFVKRASSKITYLRSHALSFWLQTDMYHIFQMKYKSTSLVKGLQVYQRLNLKVERKNLLTVQVQSFGNENASLYTFMLNECGQFVSVWYEIGVPILIKQKAYQKSCHYLEQKACWQQ